MKIKDFIDNPINFRYNILYNSIGSSSCKSSGCDDEGICRCYKITNIDIYSIDVRGVVKKIYDYIFDVDSESYKRDLKLNKILFNYGNDIDLYCIDRICRTFKLYNAKSWVAKIEDGYYGQEIGDVNINTKIVPKLLTSIDEVISLKTLKEKIEYLLLKEYGYLLDSIKLKQYNLFEINKSDVVLSQDFYAKKLEDDDMDFYSDKEYDLVRAICLKDGDKWRIIDGYHRIISTKKNKIKIIGIYD